MSKMRPLLPGVLRGLTAISIALAVSAALIFLTTPTGTLGGRLAAAVDALRCLVLGPALRSGGGVSVKNLSDVLAAMIPIVFTGLAVCVMFSAGQFNLGAEGGVMLGGFAAALVAIYVPLPPVLLPAAAVFAGALCAGGMLLVPAILKAKLGASEMVISLMLNYVVMYLIKYLLNSHLADRSKGQVMSHPFQPHAVLPPLIDNGSRLSVGFLAAMLLAVLTALFLCRTRWGYAIRMVGCSESFARYSGIEVGLMVVLSQVVGGVLAGLGGGVEMLGRYTAYSWDALPGYGWTGITVAILAGGNPAFVPLAAFFIAYLGKGCSLMAIYSGVPAQMIDILQAVIFLVLAGEGVLRGNRRKPMVASAGKAEKGGERECCP